MICVCKVRSLLTAVAEMYLQPLKSNQKNKQKTALEETGYKGRGSTQGSGEHGENDKI